MDLSMGCYHTPLDEETQKLCSTVSPWGKCQHKVSPMGIENSPDIFQEIMSNMMADLDCASTHIDDVLVASDGTFKDHSNEVKEALTRLEKANF